MKQDIDLAGYRHASWGGATGDEQITFLGDDLTGAVIIWPFADEFGESARFTLRNAQAGEQGVYVLYDEGYLHPQTGRVVGASILIPQIDMATFQELSMPTPVCKNIVLKHTFYVERDGQTAAIFSGTFTIREGVPH